MGRRKLLAPFQLPTSHSETRSKRPSTTPNNFRSQMPKSLGWQFRLNWDVGELGVTWECGVGSGELHGSPLILFRNPPLLSWPIRLAHAIDVDFCAWRYWSRDREVERRRFETECSSRARPEGLKYGLVAPSNQLVDRGCHASSSFRIFRPRRWRSFSAALLGSSRNSSTRRRIGW